MDQVSESGSRRGQTAKSASAFRTISEVSDELDVPQHVLRFWETKFSQVKPLKRGGGRRYYRPEDLALLRRIRDLLYTEGYTIRGVQRLLRQSLGRLGGYAGSGGDRFARRRGRNRGTGSGACVARVGGGANFRDSDCRSGRDEEAESGNPPRTGIDP
jgi:hypothetical protein